MFSSFIPPKFANGHKNTSYLLIGRFYGFVQNFMMKQKNEFLNSFIFTGRNDQIWTDDPFHPKEVRYQAALRPDDV